MINQLGLKCSPLTLSPPSATVYYIHKKREEDALQYMGSLYLTEPFRSALIQTDIIIKIVRLQVQL